MLEATARALGKLVEAALKQFGFVPGEGVAVHVNRGFASGGFVSAGDMARLREGEVAGIVHAGESWVELPPDFQPVPSPLRALPATPLPQAGEVKGGAADD